MTPFYANPGTLFRVGNNLYGKSIPKDSKICWGRVDWSTFGVIAPPYSPPFCKGGRYFYLCKISRPQDAEYLTDWLQNLRLLKIIREGLLWSGGRSSWEITSSGSSQGSVGFCRAAITCHVHLRHFPNLPTVHIPRQTDCRVQTALAGKTADILLHSTSVSWGRGVVTGQSVMNHRICWFCCCSDLHSLCHRCKISR